MTIQPVNYVIMLVILQYENKLQASKHYELHQITMVQN